MKRFSLDDCLREGLLRRVPPSPQRADGSLKAAYRWLEDAQRSIDAEAYNPSVLSSYLAMFQPQTFSTLRRGLGLHENTMLRALRTLKDQGCVIRDDDFFWWISDRVRGEPHRYAAKPRAGVSRL